MLNKRVGSHTYVHIALIDVANPSVSAYLDIHPTVHARSHESQGQDVEVMPTDRNLGPAPEGLQQPSLCSQPICPIYT